MVPKRLPWSHMASAQPETTASMSSGRALVVKSRSSSASTDRPRMASRTLPPTRYSFQPAAAKRSASGAVSSSSGWSRSGIITGRVRRPSPPVRWRSTMTTVAAEVLQWGWARARTGPWRGAGPGAPLAPGQPGGPPTVQFLQRCLESLTARGFTRVVTSALAPAEQAAFMTLGFEEYERLHLLSHDLRDVERPAKDAGRLLRRGRSSDWPAVLAVDAAAFEPFWRLDRG